MADKSIGLKIKEQRLARRMTLKTLSEKTDLSISFLSMVERGITSAALVSLQKIADALDVDISIFFVEPKHERIGGFCRSYENNIRSISGHYIYSSLSAGNKGFSLDPMMITMLPGQQNNDVPLVVHQGEDFVYVLEGVLTYFLDGKAEALYPGDSYHGFGNIPHNFANLSNNIVKVLYIVTPPIGASGHESLSSGSN